MYRKQTWSKKKLHDIQFDEIPLEEKMKLDQLFLEEIRETVFVLARENVLGQDGFTIYIKNAGQSLNWAL